MLKKYAIVAVTLVVFAAPAVSQAAPYDDLVNQLQNLWQRVSALQAQLAQQQGSTTTRAVTDFQSCVAAGNRVMESYPRQCRTSDGRLFAEEINQQQGGTPSAFCPQLSGTLSAGARGAAVERLQRFLQAEGDYTYPVITGYFGGVTQQAVQSWQARHGVVSGGSARTTGFGVVGPQTRAAIAQYCGTGTTQPPGTDVCTLQYDPVCGRTSGGQVKTFGNQCQLGVAGAQFLYEGQCRDDGGSTQAPNDCRVWYDGCNSCSREYPGGPMACTLRACIWQDTPRCEAYFDNANNRAPVIHSFSGPTQLSVGEAGTWRINASDAENGRLMYSIDWGETRFLNAPDTPVAQTGFVQRTTFQHSYDQGGTYTITITVRDEAGNQTTSSTTVRVSGGDGGSGDVTFSATPTSGSAPLSVRFTAPGGYSCADGPDYKIAYGDGAEEFTPSCSRGVHEMRHTYSQSGTYTATLYLVPSGFGFGDRTPRTVATKTITVRDGNNGTACTLEYAPVCGVFRPGEGICVDGRTEGYCSGETKTFSNMCHLRNHPLGGFEVLHTGACN